MTQHPPIVPQSVALETAWRLYGQLHQNATAVFQKYLSLRGWLMGLSVTATLFAILTCTVESGAEVMLVNQMLRTSLVIVTISGALVFVLGNRLQQGQYWLIFRSGAAAAGKAIYCYRTLLQHEPDRHHWLNNRIADIQRQIVETIAGDWVLIPYTEQWPIEGLPESSTPDSGLSDFLADDYLQYRLAPQLDWHRLELAKLNTQRTRLRFVIIGLAGLSVLGPTLGGGFSLWVAFTTVLGSALLVGSEVCRLDEVIQSTTQLVLELNLIQSHWQGLKSEERTGSPFFQLAIATEEVLWSFYSHPATAMRQVVAELKGRSDDLLSRVMREAVPAGIERALRGEMGELGEAGEAGEAGGDGGDGGGGEVRNVEEIREAEGMGEAEEIREIGEGGAIGEGGKIGETEELLTGKGSEAGEGSKKADGGGGAIATAAKEPEKRAQRGAPHAFVVMPFGRKQGRDGNWIDFDRIYGDLIQPALAEAGFEPFRADQETVSGDILTDMFQELLLADLVIADLSIDNANVFYELGVRHSMRKRGVVHIQSGRDYMPFDIMSVRTLPYRCNGEGHPDPVYLKKDKESLVKTIQSTWKSERNRVHSPIFNLLDGLVEPDRKTLQTPLATGYWQEYIDLQERIKIAQRRKHIGDVLLLTEEAVNPLIKEDVIAEAGKALSNIGNSALALKTYRQGLKINPENIEFRCEEARHLSRLQQSNEAIVKLERLLEDEPTHIDAMAYLARIYKDLWKGKWIHIEDPEARIQEAYDASHFLQKSIESYLRGYRLNQNDYYPGINAFTLSVILDHLAQRLGPSGDPEEEAYRQQLPSLKGAVQFCLDCKTKLNPKDVWAAGSLGDLAVCTAQDPRQVAIAYKKALTALWQNKFALESILDQLSMLALLDFRPDHVKTGIAVIEEELQRYKSQEIAPDADADAAQQPAKVFLFSGHMIDAPDRPKPRFPAAMEQEAQMRIEAVLNKLEAQSNCIAITPGIACGGDILFLEACLKRKMKLEVYLPFDKAGFIQQSVVQGGDDWVERFHAIANHPNVTLHIQLHRLGPVPEGENVYERNNRWALYSTLMYGIERTRLIVLWNGQGSGAPGGTGDMVQQVRQLGGIVEHINTTQFDYWKQEN